MDRHRSGSSFCQPIRFIIGISITQLVSLSVFVSLGFPEFQRIKIIFSQPITLGQSIS
jgi:hypothetical protein